MKVTSSFLPKLLPSRVSSLLLALSVALAVVFTTSCGSSGSMPQTPFFSGNASVTVLVSSMANDQLSQFNVGFVSIALTNQAGKSVSLLSTQQTPEFIHVNGTAEPLVTVSVPRDVYTAATVTTQNSTFVCISQLPGALQISEFGGGAQPVTVSLPSPITITGTAMGLLLDLQVSQSATFSSCSGQGATYSITPTFNLTTFAISAQPTTVENGEVTSIDGLISSVSASDNTFNVSTADGAKLSLNTNAQTVYQGISGFSSLVAGTAVDIDVVVQPDGSLLATRVAVPDSDPNNLSVTSGPLLFVDTLVPALNLLPREQQGYLFSPNIGGPFAFNFSGTKFQTSGRFTNLQNLPFAATFVASNMVAGQNVLITTHALNLPYSTPYPSASTMTLMPQTINGTINAAGNEGAFATYTVTLASYDLFPQLAVQPGQTTLLTNPNEVVVYVDSNTEQVNTQPLGMGSILRFNGLLFNDNGTLRMDCGQVNDGVPE